MFSSAKKCFGTEFREFASIFVPRNGIPSCFFFRRMVRNGIPSDCFYFCSTERNSELFLFCREWFRTEFREFASIFVPRYRVPSIFLLCGMVRNGIPRVLFCGTAGILPEQNYCLCRLLRNKFLVRYCQP